MCSLIAKINAIRLCNRAKNFHLSRKALRGLSVADDNENPDNRRVSNINDRSTKTSQFLKTLVFFSKVFSMLCLYQQLTDSLVELFVK